MMRYQITSTGNTVIADQAFMDAHYPSDYTQLADDPVPVIVTVAPGQTKNSLVSRMKDAAAANDQQTFNDCLAQVLSLTP